MVGTVTRWWWVRHAPVVDHGGKIYGQGDIGCDVSDTASFEGLAAKLPEGAIRLGGQPQLIRGGLLQRAISPNKVLAIGNNVVGMISTLKAVQSTRPSGIIQAIRRHLVERVLPI